MDTVRNYRRLTLDCLKMANRAHDPATRTATFTLAGPLTTPGRLSVQVLASGVADMAANPLAKNWGKTVGILPGDFDGNGVVTDADVKAIAKRVGKVHRFADLDGSGIVDQTDVTIATNNKGKRLP